MTQSLIKTNHFSTGHFKLLIDDKPVTSFIKSVEGGLVNAQAVEEPIGQYNIRGRHLGTREIEPISVEFGMAGAKWCLDYVDDFIHKRKHHRIGGEIYHADANMVVQYMYTFSDAVITEVTLPKLDANGKESLFCKVKIQPQDVKFRLGDHRKLNPDPLGRQKAWHCTNFRLTIDSIGEMPFCSSIESMTVKLGHKPMQLGDHFRPDILPTKVDMPKLSITQPLLRSKALIDWYQTAVASQLGAGTDDAGTIGSAKGTSGYETTGSIEFLDGTLKDTLYTVELDGLGMEKFSIPKSEANAAGTKMAKFDFYVTSMKVKANGSGFNT